MSADSLEGRIPAAIVSVLGLVNGLWNVGTRVMAYQLGGIEMAVRAESRGLALLDAVVLLTGVAMLVGAVGLSLDRPWGWPTATLGFGIGLVFSLQELVTTKVGLMTVGMVLINLFVVALGIQREAFAARSLPVVSSG